MQIILPIRSNFMGEAKADEIQQLTEESDIEFIVNWIEKNKNLILILGVFCLSFLLYRNFDSILEFIYRSPEGFLVSEPVLVSECRAEVFPNDFLWSVLQTLYKCRGNESLEVRNEMLKHFQQIGFNTSEPLFREMSCEQMETALGEILELIIPTNRLPKILDSNLIIDLQNRSYDRFTDFMISWQKAHITRISNDGWWVGAAIQMQWNSIFGRSNL